MRTSVLINTHNHAPYVVACLDSVFDQTSAPDEVIVYDDASSDGTVGLLRGYRDRIVVVEGRETLGQTSRVNQGHAIHQAFLRSTGDLVFLLDGDDLFAPGKIARYREAFAGTPTPVMIQSPMSWIDQHGHPMTRMPEPFRHAVDPLATAYERQDPDLFYSTSALAFARSFLAKNLPLDWSDRTPLWSDARLACAAMFAGRIVTLPDELGRWRRHGDSDSIRCARSSRYLLELTWHRTRLFNRLADHAGRPPLSLWRNHRAYLQLGRMLFPWLGDRLSRWTRDHHDEETARE